MSKNSNLPESPEQTAEQDELIGWIQDGSEVTHEEPKEIEFGTGERADLNTPEPQLEFVKQPERAANQNREQVVDLSSPLDTEALEALTRLAERADEYVPVAEEEASNRGWIPDRAAAPDSGAVEDTNRNEQGQDQETGGEDPSGVDPKVRVAQLEAEVGKLRKENQNFFDLYQDACARCAAQDFRVSNLTREMKAMKKMEEERHAYENARKRKQVYI